MRMNKLTLYNELKNNSDILYENLTKKLSEKEKNIIEYIIFNFDIDILRLKDKKIETCFKIRNDIIQNFCRYFGTSSEF